MKGKMKITLFLLIFLKILNVSAASLSIDCNNNEVELGSNISCNLKLDYTNEIIKEITFNYTSDLDISFDNLVNIQNGMGTITFSEPLESMDNMMATIGTIIINVSENFTSGKYNIALNSIKYLNGNDLYENIEEVVKEITVLPKTEDCRLASITLNGTAVSNFSPDTYTYNVNVHTQSVFIDAVKKGDKVSITGLGTIRVKEGKTVTREIVIIDARNNRKTYTLNITNTPVEPEEEVPIVSKSGDNLIKTMNIYFEGNKLDFKYDVSKTNFTYTLVDNTITKIEVRATLNDSKAKFDDLYCPKEYNIDFGTNTFEILVIAENQDLKVYTLNIIREDHRDTDNSLLSIKFHDREIELVEDKYNYEIYAKKNFTIDDIEALAKSSSAKVTYNEILLPDGSSEVDIKVTAENGDEKDYSLIVSHLLDGELEDIKVKNYTLGFNRNTYSYDLTLINNEDEIDITVLPNDLQYVISGNENLKDGSKIIIKYTFQEEEKEYVINIHKKSEMIPATFCYLTLGIGILVFSISIIYFIKKKKK